MKSSILLAAGISSRMGTPKALLDWGGEPLIRYQIRQLFEAGLDEVVVVLGYHADEIQRQMRDLKCRVMLNPRYQMGKAGSLRIGAKAVNRDAEPVVILGVDQPRSASLIRTLVEAHLASEHPVTRPTFDERGGHPVVVAGSLRAEMMDATDEDEGLRGVLAHYASRTQLVPAGEECRLDLNTPEEYEAAVRSLAPA